MDSLTHKPLLQYILNGSHVDYASLDAETKEAIRQIGVRNMFIRNRLYELAALFQKAGIDATVLKGAHLIHTIYPFGVRPIEDIDLLIRREDFETADRIIRDLGYQDTAVGMDVWTHLMFSNKMTYLNEGNPVIPIDVHFSLGPNPYLGRVSQELLSTHTGVMEFNECHLNVLLPEMLLVHLCLHLFQHHFDDWHVSCCDIVALIRHEGDRLDWQKFYGIVHSNKLDLPVSYSLQKARELAAIKIPTSQEIGTHRMNAYDKFIFYLSRKQKRGFDRYLLQFITTPGISLKMRGARRIIFPGKPYLQLYHNGSYFNYLVNMIKTAGSMLSTVFRKK